jgi:hypothetical protein
VCRWKFVSQLHGTVVGQANLAGVPSEGFIHDSDGMDVYYGMSNAATYFANCTDSTVKFSGHISALLNQSSWRRRLRNPEKAGQSCDRSVTNIFGRLRVNMPTHRQHVIIPD